VPTPRQRLVGAAWSLRSSSKTLRLRWLPRIERSGPVHRLLRQFYRFSRRHPVGVSQWNAQYAGDYGRRLGAVNEVTHHMVIVGYLAYGAKAPGVLDVGCGHGRFLQLLSGFGFSKYVGIDWSAEAIEQARSLSIPNTRLEVADMDHWETSDRFDAVVLNESLYYSADDPRQLFERALGWLTEDGIVIVSMFRNFGSRYIWSEIRSDGVEELAACEVKDNTTGKVWDVKALRPHSASVSSRSHKAPSARPRTGANRDAFGTALGRA
jgi:SAM-dependent methyltransferase